MSRKLLLALAASAALGGPALAEGGGGVSSNGVGWLLNPGPVYSAPAATAAFAQIGRSRRRAPRITVRTPRDTMFPWAGSYQEYRDMLRFGASG